MNRFNNCVLAQVLKKTIQDNQPELIKEFVPTFETIVADFFKNLIVHSIAKVPYDKLFPIHTDNHQK